MKTAAASRSRDAEKAQTCWQAPAEGLAWMRAQLRESCRVKQSFSDDLLRRLWHWARVSEAALERGRRIFLFGNGGSAADAQHIVAELVGRFSRRRRCALPAIALTTNASVMTAIANDFDYAEVFARQVEALAGPGDVVIGITTSGRSPNVLQGLRAASGCGAFTVCLTGANGAHVPGLAELVIDAPSVETQRIQESHITIGHIYCDLLDAYFARRSHSRRARPAGWETTQRESRGQVVQAIRAKPWRGQVVPPDRQKRMK